MSHPRAPRIPLWIALVLTATLLVAFFLHSIQPSQAPVATLLEHHSSESVMAFRQLGTNALPELIEMISPHSRPRLKVIQWVQTLKKTPLAPLIPTSLTMAPEHFNPTLARQGFRMLGKIATPAIPALEALAQTPATPENAQRAIEALQGIGTNALPALSNLTTNCPCQLEAIAACVELGMDRPPYEPLLARLIKQDIEEAELWGTPRRSPTEVLPILKNSLRHPNPHVRKAAADLLPRLKAPTESQAVIPELLHCLHDTDGQVQRSSMHALSIIAPDLLTNTPAQ
jgi:hypothetical protein